MWQEQKKLCPVSPMFSPHFEVICDLLQYRPMATWNLFVLYDKKAKYCECHPYVCPPVDHR